MFPIDNEEKKRTILKSFHIAPEIEETDDLEKGGKKTGIYADTAENRKLKRVGKKYSKDSVEEPGKEKKPKKEDPSGTKDKKAEDPETKGKEKTPEDHAKETSDEDLQSYIDSASDDDPNKKAAEKELARRKGEGKNPHEKEIMSIDEQIGKLSDKAYDLRLEAEDSGEPYKSDYEEMASKMEADIEKLEAKKEKLLKKSEDSKKTKLQKDDKAYAKIASLEEITKIHAKLSDEVVEHMNNKDYAKAKKASETATIYGEEILNRVNSVSEAAKKEALQKEKAKLIKQQDKLAGKTASGPDVRQKLKANSKRIDEINKELTKDSKEKQINEDTEVKEGDTMKAAMDLWQDNDTGDTLTEEQAQRILDNDPEADVEKIVDKGDLLEAFEDGLAGEVGWETESGLMVILDNETLGMDAQAETEHIQKEIQSMVDDVIGYDTTIDDIKEWSGDANVDDETVYGVLSALKDLAYSPDDFIVQEDTPDDQNAVITDKVDDMTKDVLSKNNSISEAAANDILWGILMHTNN